MGKEGVVVPFPNGCIHRVSPRHGGHVSLRGDGADRVEGHLSQIQDPAFTEEAPAPICDDLEPPEGQVPVRGAGILHHRPGLEGEVGPGIGRRGVHRPGDGPHPGIPR